MNTAVNTLPIVTTDAGVRRWFKDAGRRLWRAMEATGQARAQRHLLEFAYQCEVLQPELAKELRAAAVRGPQA